MLNLTRIVAAVLAMSNGLALADTWELGVKGLYLRPSFAGNGLGYSSFSNYAGADNSQVIISSNSQNHINNITPDWDWSFELDGGYWLSETSNINLSWYHYQDNVSGHLPYGSLFSGSVDGFYADHLSVDTEWDAIHLDASKKLGCHNKFINLHAGLSYANIKATFTNQPKIFIDSSPYFTSTDTIRYQGVGPRFGIDFHYMVDDLSFYLKTAGSVLVGKARQYISGYQNYSNTIYGLIPFGIPNYDASNNHVIVPEIEAKLGIKYDHEFCYGNLGVDLGYLWINYMSAMVSYTGIGVVGSSIGLPATTNFNLNGAYLGFTWTIA